MVNVESSTPGLVELVAAGITWPVLLVDGKYCGPEIEPAGPMIGSTWLGVKVLTCMGRSNVTLSVLVVPLVIRLLLPLPPGTEVLRTCGPGTISGRVF